MAFGYTSIHARATGLRNLVSYTSSTKPLKVGDRVKIVSDLSGHHIPLGHIFIIQELSVQMGLHVIPFKERHQPFILYDDVEVINIDLPKTTVFDLEKLNALVISPEVKEEITAVLKQHKFKDHLFEKWGLGETIEYGRGMTFLFHGLPGTGKTWGAECIAKVLGMSLMRIAGAEIQSSEPGGAERNIKQAFETAKKESKLLFFDECDSLIFSRSDVGMILGGEINTLLTEIERYEGIVILATNRVEHLDSALERRIALIVEFPEPTFEQRKLIWQGLLPKKMPLDENVSIAKLAEFKLTGGQIKNVVLQAARLALSSESKVVTITHFTSAIDRVNKSKSLLGTKSNFSQIDYHRS